MQWNALEALTLCSLLVGCAVSPSQLTVDEARQQVLATERAFAKTMADRDLRAFATFIAEEAVFFSGPTPLRGKLKIVDSWTRFYATPVAPFSWEPEDVEVLESGTLALSSGPVRDLPPSGGARRPAYGASFSTRAMRFATAQPANVTRLFLRQVSALQTGHGKAACLQFRE